MTRTMYDAITPTHIPHDAEMVAGYVGGRWPSYYGYTDGDGNHIPSIRDQFPNAVHVSIAVEANQDADVLDVERYDATPAQAPAWVERQRKRGAQPTVYCSESVWPDVRHAFNAANVADPDYWIANYDGHAVIPDGAVAKQYENTPGYDVSLVADCWPRGAAHEPVTPVVTRHRHHIHYVLRGETLSGIAEHYGIEWQRLWHNNRSVIGSDPDLIHPGQRLVIP